MARSLAVNRALAIRAALFAGGLVSGVAVAAAVIVGMDGYRSPGTSGSAPIVSAPAATYAAASQVATASAAPALSPEARAAVDQRIDELRTRLGIGASQAPLWSAFTQAMRDNAAATDALFRNRATAVSTMSAVENMRSYALIARAYADNTERLSTAFENLYASLSDEQKQAADALFREQAIAAAKPQSEH